MRKRMTRRVAVDQETIVAEQLVKLAKSLMAEEADNDVDVEEEPKFNELKMSIKSKLSKFNKKGLLKKRLQSIKGLSVANQMVNRMSVMDLFELVDDILSL